MERLGKYIELKMIGQGASATVYRGLHQQLRVHRALKVFDQDKGPSRRRLSEALHQARVEHRNIVRVMDLEQEGGSGPLYLVMEYAPLGTLRDRLAQGPLPPETACDLAAQVAEALEAAHGRQVWHLDLKPENVLFFEPDLVKIGDFGLARSPGEPLERAWLLGTPNYMAPEQLQGQPGPACDLWALGAMLFEMLSGRLCFAGEKLSQVQTAVQKGPGDLWARLARAGADPPDQVVRLLERLLAPLPAQRPASAQEAARALRQAAGGQAGQELPTQALLSQCQSCGQRVPPGQDLCPDCQEEAEPASVQAPRPTPARWPLRLAAPALGLALTLAAAFAWQPLDRPADQPAPLPAATSQPSSLPPEAPAGPPDAAQPAPQPTPTQPSPSLALAAPPAQAKPAPAKAAKPAAVKALKAKPVPVKAAKPAVAQALKAKPTPVKTAKAKPVEPAPIKAAPVRTAKKPRTKPPLNKTPAPAKAASASPGPAPSKAQPQLLAAAQGRQAPGQTIESLRDFLRQHPEHLGARRNLALLYMQLGDAPAARAQLKAILRLRPQDPEARAALELIERMYSNK